MSSPYDDSATYTPAEVDWSVFNPDKVEHVRTVLAAALDGPDGCPGHYLNALALTFGDAGRVSRIKGSKSLVDLSGVVAAVDSLAVSKIALDGTLAEHEEIQRLVIEAKDRVRSDRERLQAAIRSAFASGATNPSLVRVTGLSSPRISQIVAGARG